MAQSTYSVTFDGSNDIINVPSMPVPSGDLTLSIWIKTSTTPQTDRGIFGRWDGAGMMLYTTSSNIYFYAGSAGQNIVWTGGLTTIADGNWHHLAGTKSSTSGTIYHNGSSVATGTLGATTGSPADNGNIGSYSNRGTSCFNGQLDDAALFSSALSGSTIASIASGGTDVSTLSPDGLWRLEEGSGTSAADSGSGGHSGTLANGPTWSSDVSSVLAGGASQDTPELYGRPFGRQGQRQQHQLLAQ